VVTVSTSAPAQGGHDLDRVHGVGAGQAAEHLWIPRRSAGAAVEAQRSGQRLDRDGEHGDIAVWVGGEHEREHVGLVAELVPLQVERFVVGWLRLRSKLPRRGRSTLPSKVMVSVP
jgi:hypothetical protein